MDKATAQALGEDVRDVLAPLAERYGLTVTVEGGKYDVGGKYEPKVVFSSVSFAQTEWNRYAVAYDLPPNMVGVPFESDGHTWVVRGFRPKNRSYPLAVEDEFGAPRKMRVTAVVRAALYAKHAEGSAR